ncbi:AAA family ATPase [Pediococcus pentosaceus]|uniref:AAA family ATPase n=1 Tax=Pediococcus pentosaceus TaxID=1255 RepID=UPI003981BB84
MPKYYKEGSIPAVGNMYFIYGGKATGKTSLAKLFPGLKLLFSFDGSTNALAETNDVRVVAFGHDDAPHIQSQVTFELNRFLYTEDEQGNKIINPDIGTIVLDNVSALQNWVIDNIENGAKDGRQNWNLTQKWFRDLGDFLRETKLPVLATAHEIDATLPGKYKPDMNDKTANAFTSWFDVMGRIYKHDSDYLIDVDPEQGNKGANRLDDRKLIKADELLQPVTEPKDEEN